MTDITVAEIENEWWCLTDGCRIAGPFKSNGEAWRKAERLEADALHVRHDFRYRTTARIIPSVRELLEKYGD